MPGQSWDVFSVLLKIALIILLQCWKSEAFKFHSLDHLAPVLEVRGAQAPLDCPPIIKSLSARTFSSVELLAVTVPFCAAEVAATAKARNTATGPTPGPSPRHHGVYQSSNLLFLFLSLSSLGPSLF